MKMYMVPLIEIKVAPLMVELGISFKEAVRARLADDTIDSEMAAKMIKSYEAYVAKLCKECPPRATKKEASTINEALAHYHQLGLALKWDEARVLEDWNKKWHLSMNTKKYSLTTKKDTKQ